MNNKLPPPSAPYKRTPVYTKTRPAAPAKENTMKLSVKIVLLGSALAFGVGMHHATTRPDLVATKAPAPAVNAIEFGDIRVSNITLQKVSSATARSGYVFVFRGNVTNGGVEELTRAGSISASVGSCLLGKVKDNKGRKFDVSCDIPALLPSETAKNFAFAQSTAMSDSTTAQFCSRWLSCTDQLKPKN